MKLLILMNVHTTKERIITYRKVHSIPGTDMEQIVKELLDNPTMMWQHTGTHYDWDKQISTVSFDHTNPADDFHQSYIKAGYRLLYKGIKPCDM